MGAPSIPIMKTKILLFRLVLVLAALLPAHAVRAAGDDDDSDHSGQIRVDVVVDMTEAGHKIAHPTPAQPAYYLPLSVGYKEFGFQHHFQRPPPNAWDVEHALAKALYNEGYQLMSKQGHPSLVLVFWWGYMAPENIDVDDNTYIASLPNAFQSGGSHDTFGSQEGSALWGPGATKYGPSGGYFMGGSGAPNGGIAGQDNGMNATTAFNVFPTFSFGGINANEEKMLSLVAGNTIDDHQKYPDPRLDDVVQMTTAARYYVLVSAFDFQSWLHHKPVLLWRAHVSTELWGHYFDQVVGTLINTAAPMFGRETKVPHFISAPVLPLGRVIVGTPEVKDYQSPSSR